MRPGKKIVFSYLSVTSNLIVFPRNWRRLFMRVQISASWTVFQSDQVAVSDEFDGVGAVPERHRFVELLDEPAVVSVLVRVSGYLLLLSPDTGRIQVHV